MCVYKDNEVVCVCVCTWQTSDWSSGDSCIIFAGRLLIFCCQCAASHSQCCAIICVHTHIYIDTYTFEYSCTEAQKYIYIHSCKKFCTSFMLSFFCPTLTNCFIFFIQLLLLAMAILLEIITTSRFKYACRYIYVLHIHIRNNIHIFQ